MDVIGELGRCGSVHLKERLRSGMVVKQVEQAIAELQGGQGVTSPLGFRGLCAVCCGIYVVRAELTENLEVKDKLRNDSLYTRMKEAMRASGVFFSLEERSFTASEREQLVELLASFMAMDVTAVVEQQLFGDTATQRPPCIFDQSGWLNQPYVELLRCVGIKNFTCCFGKEKPIIVCCPLDEAEFQSKLRTTDSTGHMADWLLQFIDYKCVELPPSRLLSPTLRFGAWVELKDYIFSRFQIPLRFRPWAAMDSIGAVGVFVDMDHPDLGRARFGLTCAHVVFPRLGVANQAEVDDFNQTIPYAHFDTGFPEAAIRTSLDFCMLEVPGYAKVQNCVSVMNPNEARLTDPDEMSVGAGSNVIKTGAVSNCTVGTIVGAGNSDGRCCIKVAGLTNQQSQVAIPGDSGSVFIFVQPNTGVARPVAMLIRGSQDDVGRGVEMVYGACSIIDCLRKFVQKNSVANQLPTVADVQTWFTLSSNAPLLWTDSREYTFVFNYTLCARTN